MKILIGGSPCTHWSIAQTKNRETEASGIGWELFLNYRIARDKYHPDYFLYENNKSMSPAIRAQITAELGVEPVLINSALVSAQNRQRLYWVGKREPDGTYSQVRVEQPEDKGILLRDILETVVVWREKGYALQAECINGLSIGKSRTVDAHMGKLECCLVPRMNDPTSVYDASVQLCAELNSANHGTVKLRFGVDGDWRVSAGNCIALTGFGNLNGKYFVDKVTHKVSKSGLTTDFECSGIGPAFHSWDVGGKIVYHEKTADSGVSYDSTYATTSPAAGAASAAAGGEAGQAITLNKAPLYVSSTAKNKAGTKTGTYWLYDGILINGRYRVTNSAARCGKLPVGQNVTGWVPASYCIASEEAKK